MMQQLSAEARNLNWLVSNFVERVPGVREATVVSSDGLLIALSDGLDRSSGDRLAAVSAGLLSIAKGGSTLRDYVDSRGEPGYFQLDYGVYGRKGLPCRNCGVAIREIRQGGRATSFCPRCQR